MKLLKNKFLASVTTVLHLYFVVSLFADIDTVNEPDREFVYEYLLNFNFKKCTKP
jgi:hypothetical protein